MCDNYIVHACNHSELPKILKAGTIKGSPYTSFSEGFPRAFAHGNCFIIFDRDKLRNKGYTLIPVEYTKKFFKENPDIKQHISEYKSLEELQKMYIDMCRFHIERLRATSVNYNEDCERQLQYYLKSLKLAKNNPNCMVGSQLEQLSCEKEIVCKEDIIFDISDVVGIIHQSKTFEQYCPVDIAWHRKVLFADDYLGGSCDLNTRANEVGSLMMAEYLAEMENRRGAAPTQILLMYMLPYIELTRPDLKDDIVKFEIDSINLPKLIAEMISNIDKMGDNLCHPVINYVFSTYCINYLRGNKSQIDLKYEKWLYNKYRAGLK